MSGDAKDEGLFMRCIARLQEEVSARRKRDALIQATQEAHAVFEAERKKKEVAATSPPSLSPTASTTISKLKLKKDHGWTSDLKKKTHTLDYRPTMDGARGEGCNHVRTTRTIRRIVLTDEGGVKEMKGKEMKKGKEGHNRARSHDVHLREGLRSAGPRKRLRSAGGAIRAVR
jgi:hypothetical protein